ncbi:MAG: hypothetical protein ACLU3I_16055 [Acutalibacteraceae bacterium]
MKELPPERIEQAAGCRLLLPAALDEYGPDETICRLLRTLRKHPDCLSGSYGGVIVDGGGELYTKQTAREAGSCGKSGRLRVSRQAARRGDRFSLQPAYSGWDPASELGADLCAPAAPAGTAASEV